MVTPLFSPDSKRVAYGAQKGTKWIAVVDGQEGAEFDGLGLLAFSPDSTDRGGERAAAIYTLIATAKLNDIDPQAWLADVLARIADHPASHIHELLPWHWKATQNQAAAA
jgi:IS66 C-terminal element